MIGSFFSVYAQDNWEFIVKDSAQYDIKFLNYWRHVKPYSLAITNDSILVNKEYNNPILIPTDLPLNKESYYELKSSNTIYQLTVKRINYTNIEYTIKEKTKHKIFFSRQGTAILEPSFHLGAEGVYQKDEDEIYGMNEYHAEMNELREIKLLIPAGTDERIEYIEQQGETKLHLPFSKTVK